MMDANGAITALGALAQEHRLSLFRLLVRAGPDGLAAGEIASALGMRRGTVSAAISRASAHFKRLEAHGE